MQPDKPQAPDYYASIVNEAPQVFALQILETASGFSVQLMFKVTSDDEAAAYNEAKEYLVTLLSDRILEVTGKKPLDSGCVVAFYSPVDYDIELKFS